MNRRDFLKRLVAAAVPALGVVAGCAGGKEAAGRRPPAPYFGPRRSGRAGLLRPSTQPATATAASGAATGLGDWRPRGGERRWRYIVVHHSATTWGSAADFDRIHRSRGWDELGYHFVIGNGAGTPDGCVEVGSRWRKQKHGAHCKVADHPEYNDVGIGICLVGNFNTSCPSEAQMASLVSLVRFLMGRYRIPRGHVYGHRDLKATDCPCRHFDLAALHSRL